MNDLLDRIRTEKTNAKNLRDEAKYAEGASTIDKVIGDLEKELSSATSSNAKPTIAGQLADSYGIKGGIHRRWALESPDPEIRRQQLLQSIKAYDAGYVIEQNESYDLSVSYCMLNRLLSRILLSPTCVADRDSSFGEDVVSLNVHAELTKAAQRIEAQLKGVERGNSWAEADNALVRLLLRLDNPLSAYQGFTSTTPPDYVYESVLSTLRPLMQLPLESARDLEEAVWHLEDCRQELSRST